VAAFVVLVNFGGAQESGALHTAAPTWTTVGSRFDTSKQAVDVSVTQPAPAVVKSNATGIVTSVNVTKGQQLATGTLVAVVSGAPIYALVAAAPPYRDLAVGDKGSDVTAVGALLVSLGMLPPGGVRDTFGSEMARATSSLERRDGQAVDGIFHISFIAWAPPKVSKIGSIAIRVGDEVGQGAALLTGADVPSQVSFSITGSSNERPTVPDVELSLSAGAAKLTFHSLQPDANERTSIADFLDTGLTSGALTSNTSGATTTYSGSIVQVAKPRQVGVVPSGAIYVDAAGKACIFERASNGRVAGVTLDNPSVLIGELGSVSVPAQLVHRQVALDGSVPGRTHPTCK
jgi:hypothetical protein